MVDIKLSDNYRNIKFRRVNVAKTKIAKIKNREAHF